MSGGQFLAPAPVYDWLTRHARARPGAAAVTSWRDGAVRGRLDFGELLALVDRHAAGLAVSGAAAGDRVLLVLPNDETFVVTMVACLRAGLIAVPAPTPKSARDQAFRERIRAIAADCRPALTVTAERWAGSVRAALDTTGPAAAILTQEELVSRAHHPAPAPAIGLPGDTAFLQYTSGSTGHPKGVALSHRAVQASCAQAAAAYAETPDDTAVTWVPLHHDMGLVTGVLRPLYTGYESVLLTPREFVRSPASWLSALSECRGTLSSAPDFAYAHCVRRVPADAAASFDLSAWRVARDAGEVVRAETAERFAAHFAGSGFAARSFCPSYGMAEATLTVTATTPQEPALRISVRRHDLQRGWAVPAGERTCVDDPVVPLLSSGTPLPGTQLKIRPTEPTDTRAGEACVPRPNAEDGRIGEILVRGPQLLTGYWPVPSDRPPRRRAWHATGDLGFVHRGHLFVVGRRDDTLVHNGRKFHAADIAAACAAIPALRPGRCAAFTAGPLTEPPHRGAREAPPYRGPYEGRVFLVTEVSGPMCPPTDRLAQDIRRHLAETLGLYVSDVAFLAPGRLPVTTSGKVRVAETGRRFLRGELPLLNSLPALETPRPPARPSAADPSTAADPSID